MADKIQTIFNGVDDHYTFWDNTKEGRAVGAKALEKFNSSDRTARGGRYSGIPSRDTYTDIDTRTSVRPEFNRFDYEFFRPGESLPTTPKGIIKSCMQAYDRFAIIRNAIDLMGDFACQGVEIAHPIEKHERLFRAWFEMVRGKDRSERFLNLLYQSGNVFVYRTNRKLAKGAIQKLYAKANIMNDVKPKKNELPISYFFLNPLALDVSDKISTITGEPIYMLKPHENVIKRLEVFATGDCSQVLPKELQDLFKRRKNSNNGVYDQGVPLDETRLRSFFYKKKDWDAWSRPFISSMLSSLILLSKMELADFCALDGAISHVRLWTLGDLEQRLAPSPAAAQYLARILENNVGSGVIDVIWGPDLKLTESKSTVQKDFLGAEKYEPVIDTIYTGLGLPRTLTSGGGSTGFTNNYISLQTLIKRLEYGREKLREFWVKEFKLVAEALNIPRLPTLKFEFLDMSDPVRMKALILQMYDRGLISHETLLDMFGEKLNVEQSRMGREDKKRKKNKLPKQKGPFEKDQKTGQPQQGRPNTSDDKQKRDPKQVSITKANDGVEDNIEDINLESESNYETSDDEL